MSDNLDVLNSGFICKRCSPGTPCRLKAGLRTCFGECLSLESRLQPVRRVLKQDRGTILHTLDLPRLAAEGGTPNQEITPLHRDCHNGSRMSKASTGFELKRHECRVPEVESTIPGPPCGGIGFPFTLRAITFGAIPM